MDDFPKGTTMPAILPNPLDSPITVPALRKHEKYFILLVSCFFVLPVRWDCEGVVGVSRINRPIKSVRYGHDGCAQVRWGRLLGHPDHSCDKTQHYNIELLPLTLLPAAGNRNDMATFTFWRDRGDRTFFILRKLEIKPKIWAPINLPR